MPANSSNNSNDLDNLRLQIHAAALEPDLWHGALASLTRLVRARTSHLAILDRATRAFSFLPVNQGLLDARREVDPGTRRLVRGRSIEPLKHEDGNRVLTHIAVNNERMWSAVTARRAQRDAAFGEPERRIMNDLTPHLANAVAVHLRLVGLEERIAATDAALDRLPLGICLLDQAGRIMHRNAAARAMLAAGDGLAERSGSLRAAAPADDRELAARIRAAVAPAGQSAPRGGTLLIGRPSLRRPYSVLVTPLSAARDRVGGVIGQTRPRALVLLTDPEEAPCYPADLLTQRYRLTAAEARLACELVAGSSLQDAAGRFGVAVGTARNQLKQIFLKTDVNRQAELVRLLASDLAAQAARLAPAA